MVDQNGEKIAMEILLPKDGDYIFDDPIKKNRFVYLKNNKSSITFDHDLGDGSFVMHINYLPLLPQGEEYTFLIKDISNGILQRYKAEFSQFNKDELSMKFADVRVTRAIASPTVSRAISNMTSEKSTPS